MVQNMTNRQRVQAVLRGNRPDKIPFTIYDWKIPWGYDKRKLRERGLVMMERFPGWRAEYPHCELTMLTFTQDGHKYEREIVKTPRGEITSLFLPDQTCNVRKQVEFWIKEEADYEPLMFMINDTVVHPAYEEIEAAKDTLGEDGVVYVWPGYSPLQEIILHLTGIEPFCYELADRPSLLWELYEALWQRDRAIYPIVARAPVEIVQYGVNPTASVLGRSRFVDKVLPCIEECAEVVHPAGKLLSVHVDGDNAIWATDLARSSVDIIEAFTPAPMTDMTMAEAREAFKDKILWVNFPSSIHLSSADTIRATTKEILDCAAANGRFIMGVTEDIPPDCWRTSLNAILDVI